MWKANLAFALSIVSVVYFYACLYKWVGWCAALDDAERRLDYNYLVVWPVVAQVVVSGRAQPLPKHIVATPEGEGGGR